MSCQCNPERMAKLVEQTLEDLSRRNFCATCGIPLTGRFFMCEETMCDYCPECFEILQCEELHGEGCMTMVFQS